MMVEGLHGEVLIVRWAQGLVDLTSCWHQVLGLVALQGTMHLLPYIAARYREGSCQAGTRWLAQLL